jgi:diguanylate cyclase (GGDEF)-like protein
MRNDPGIVAAEGQWSASSEQLRRSTGMKSVLGLVLVVALSIPVTIAADALGSGAMQYVLLALLMTVVFAPIVFVLYRTTVVEQERSRELAASLQQELVDALQHAESEAHRREVQVRQREFETRLANALEMADGESEVIDAVERALAATLPRSPVEMLLADNSHAHLARVAVSAPPGEEPACPVDSPDHCPAARRAQVQRFDDSDALDACPKLRGRTQGRCSAVCVPVSIMGRTVGVLHATETPERHFDEDQIQDLATLANLAGARIGLLRVMAETQLQAATDSLTGLLNRRSLETSVRALHGSATPFALVIADLDHFKELNDTYGHETGDRALRVFAQTLRASLRGEDVVCRHGGEEFAVVLPRCSGNDARASFEQVRTNLAVALLGAGLPQFTVSFGIVEASPHEDLAELVSRADTALFESKREGRDRVTVHDSDGRAIGEPPASARGGGARRRNGAATSRVVAGNGIAVSGAPSGEERPH